MQVQFATPSNPLGTEGWVIPPELTKDIVCAGVRYKIRAMFAEEISGLTFYSKAEGKRLHTLDPKHSAMQHAYWCYQDYAVVSSLMSINDVEYDDPEHVVKHLRSLSDETLDSLWQYILVLREEILNRYGCHVSATSNA